MIKVAIVNHVAGKNCIAEQECELIRTASNQPAIVVRVSGLLFPSGKRTFVFAEHATLIEKLTYEQTRKQLKAGRFRAASERCYSIGLVGVLFGTLMGLVASATVPRVDGVGLIVTYQREPGKPGFFALLSSTAAVDEIVSSMPKERVRLPS